MTDSQQSVKAAVSMLIFSSYLTRNEVRARGDSELADCLIQQAELPVEVVQLCIDRARDKFEEWVDGLASEADRKRVRYQMVYRTFAWAKEQEEADDGGESDSREGMPWDLEMDTIGMRTTRRVLGEFVRLALAFEDSHVGTQSRIEALPVESFPLLERTVDGILARMNPHVSLVLRLRLGMEDGGTSSFRVIGRRLSCRGSRARTYYQWGLRFIRRADSTGILRTFLELHDV